MTKPKKKFLTLLRFLIIPGIVALSLATDVRWAMAGQKLAAKSPYGFWIGNFVTDQGTSCPGGDLALMRITPKEMIFVPRTGPLVLRGTPNKKQQHYHAEILKQDLNKDPFPIVFNATPQGENFYGVYGSPTCRAHLILRRTKMW